MAVDLHSELAPRGLATDVVGSRVIVLESAGSTNERALQLGGDGTVVVADRQTAGRGRHGRPWNSEPGVGLWFSVAFEGVQEGAAFAGPLAVRDALAGHCTATIKWPNDMLLDGKKFGGILAESRGGITVLGIGLNVLHDASMFPEDLRATATSIKAATGLALDRRDLLGAVLNALDVRIGAIRAGAIDAVRAEWAAACAMEGRRIRHQGELGTVIAIDKTGGLVVNFENGRRHVVFGDIIERE